MTDIRDHLGDHPNSGLFVTGTASLSAYFLGLAADINPAWQMLGIVLSGVMSLVGQIAIQEWRMRRKENKERNDLLKENTQLAQELVKVRQKYGE